MPIRDFTGMTRLADTLDHEERSDLARSLANGVLDSVARTGLETIVITSDSDVSQWARQHSATICEDPGTGLSEAASAGVSMVGTAPWFLIHADLPLVTTGSIHTIAHACVTTTVIVPSYDGGTTVIGGRGPFAFSYGIGSFRRHFASAPDAMVIVSPKLSIDIDTEHGLELIPGLIGG